MLQVVLPPQPRSVAVARWLLTEWCAPWVARGDLDSDTVERAELLVSEVVTNGIVHGSGLVRMGARIAPGFLHVEVADEGGGMPLVGAQRSDAEHGRGMAMVELLSSRWGTELGVGPLGKTVWFELRPEPA